MNEAPTRTRAFAERAALTSMFRVAMDIAADAMVFLNRRTMRFVEANAAACRMFGYPREELLEIGLAQLQVAPADQARSAYDSVFAGLNANEAAEMRICRKDGSRVAVEVNWHAIHPGANWIIIGIIRDLDKQNPARNGLGQFGAAMDALADAAYLTDRRSMRFIYVNEWACRFQGKSREEMLALSPWQLFSIPRGELEHEYDLLIAKGGEEPAQETARVLENGSSVWIERRRRAHLEGDRWIIVSVFRDVTERKRADARIAYLNRVYAMLSGISALIVRVHEREELFKETCRLAVAAGGFRMAWIGLVGKDPTTFTLNASASSNSELLTELRGLFPAGSAVPFANSAAEGVINEKQPFVSNDSQNDPRVKLRKRHADYDVRSMILLPLIVSDSAVGVLALCAGEVDFFHDEELKLLAQLAADVSFAVDHIAKRERLDYLAYYDALTGLANRNLFVERVAQDVRGAMTRGDKLVVVLIDLERFRNINDSLGRAAGDSLLKQVATWLTLKTGDASLLARVGTDHFAVSLAPVKDISDVEGLVETLIDALVTHPFRLNEAVFRIAARAGAAVYPKDGSSAEGLFRNAEAALKKAKAAGERCVFFNPRNAAAVVGTFTLENQLRQALDRDEFVLHYQPKISLETGRLTGVEALIRWNDPQTGLVPPARFIPVLEETGLIFEVGRWGLRKAIEDYLHWRAIGLNVVPVAVNVSPRQLRQATFVDEIKRKIGVDPHAAAGLELELTESLIMEDVKHSIATLGGLRDLGVTVAIDDFGTGFSSLSYLAKLPVDALKIDRSFVIEMTESPEGLALVSTIIKLAHSLKLKVVAEGVETEEQKGLLRLLGCEEMQGFLFSKAVPAAILQMKYLQTP